MTPRPAARVRSFRRILRQFERAQRFQLEEQDACCGLSIAQCHPLLEIRELGEATTGDLARRLKLDKSTLSRSIDGLVRRGLVRRKTHENDRRFLPLTLTARGRRLCDEINRRNDRRYERILRRIPQPERDELIRLFELLVQAMTSARDSTARSGSTGGDSRTSPGRPARP
jgi:DNA-binding MarR family transcriptional regulator